MLRSLHAAAMTAMALTVTAVALVVGADVGTAAVPAAAAGWRLTFSDDFGGSSLGSSWFTYGSPYSAGTSYFRPDDVIVSGGMLHLRIEQREYDGMPYTSGGAGLNAAQVYGRYEFLAKPPVGKGIDSYITLWPPDSDSDTDATLVELLAIPGDQNAYLTNGYGPAKEYATVPGTYADAFHDYVIEWTPSYLSITIDGRSVFRSTHVPTVRRFLAFAVSNGDNLTGTPDASTQLPADFLVEQVREWAYAPGAGGAPAATAKAPTATAAHTTAHPTPSGGTPTPTPTSPVPDSPALPPSRSSGTPAALRAVGDVSGGGPPVLLPVLVAGGAGVLVVGAALFWHRRLRGAGPVGRHR